MNLNASLILNPTSNSRQPFVSRRLFIFLLLFPTGVGAESIFYNLNRESCGLGQQFSSEMRGTSASRCAREHGKANEAEEEGCDKRRKKKGRTKRRGLVCQDSVFATQRKKSIN